MLNKTPSNSEVVRESLHPVFAFTPRFGTLVCNLDSELVLSSKLTRGTRRIQGIGKMLTLRLFHCDTLGGNQAYEDRFQMFSCRRDSKEQVQVSSETELHSLIREARTDPFNNSVVRRLGDLLHTSLDEASYELFIDSISVVASMIFYDNLLGSGASVDFDATKRHHYQKYCIYKFASFLDLLRPGSMFWRGQAESASMALAGEGLRRFEKANAENRASILSRWIQQPGPNAFSERRATRSQMLQRRREFLSSLPSRSPTLCDGTEVRW